MRYGGLLLWTGLVLGGCLGSSSEERPQPKSRPPPESRPPPDDKLPVGDQGGVEKTGTPYRIAGRWYYPQEDPYYNKVGIASWYGQQFHGKITANGEIFNMNALTAAHKTLPLPSYVKVTNLGNGRTLVLRVNDRGPFVGDRLIDVSRRAAQLLGFDRQGLARVRVEASDEKGHILARKQPDTDNKKAVGQRHFVQLGAFASKKTAKRFKKKAQGVGVAAELGKVQRGKLTLWRVRVGPYKRREQAQRVLDLLLARGFYEAQLYTEASG